MIFLISSLFVFYLIKSHKYQKKLVSLSLFIFPLILFIAVRPFSWGADADTYIEIYNQVVSGLQVEQEITFIIISRIVNFLGNFVKILFIFYGICSVYFKVDCIKKKSYFPLISFLLYFSCWFILHDVYQIRVGAAIAFFYVSIPFLQNRKYKKFLILALIATLFHTQAVLIFFLVLLPKRKINTYSILFLIFLVLISYFVYFLKIDLLESLIGNFSNLRVPRFHQIEYYYQIAKSDSINLGKINAFSPIVLIRLFLTFILLFNYKKLNSIPNYPVIIRILLMSFAVRMFFYPIPVLGMRIYEFFTCVDIFIFPLFFKLIKEKKLVFSLIVFYCLFMLSITLKGTL